MIVFLLAEYGQQETQAYDIEDVLDHIASILSFPVDGGSLCLLTWNEYKPCPAIDSVKTTKMTQIWK